MKLLFLGCSYTAGCELRDREKYRFSTIVGQKLNAEVVNLAMDGYSNHAIARKFLEQDILADFIDGVGPLKWQSDQMT